jgi:PAS domain S-box-containing protein
MVLQPALALSTPFFAKKVSLAMPDPSIDKRDEQQAPSPQPDGMSAVETPQGNDFFKNIFENHSAVMMLIDAESGSIVDANRAAAKFYGWTVNQLRSMKIHEIDAPSWAHEQPWLKKLSEEKEERFFSMHRKADGTLSLVELNFGTITLENKTLILAIIQDNIERYHFAALTEFRRHLLEMADNASTEDLLTYTLDEAERLTGSTLGFFNLISDDQSIMRYACSSNAKKDNCGHAKHPSVIDFKVQADVIQEKRAVIHNDHATLRHCNCKSASHKKAIRELIVPIIRNSKVMATLEIGNKPANYDQNDIRLLNELSGVAWDIIARKYAEDSAQKTMEAMQHTQKMDMIGRLAGGIAHDINNVLSTILGHTEIVIEELNDKSPYVKNLLNIRDSTMRAAHLIQQLLAFARKQTILPKILELDTALHDEVPMLQKLIGEKIHLELRPGSHGAKILIDPSQFEQLITSLCANAREAINGTGSVMIETSSITVSPSDCYANHPCQVPGNFAMISVIDNGCGIDKNVLPYIFDPFFTTKEVGKGSGMGLSTVYGIVAQNKGYIECESTPGKGSRFTIYLPLCEEMLVPDRKKPRKDTASTDEQQTILVIDDNEAILYIVKTVLEKSGYRVLSTTSANEAINIVANSGKKIDMLLTDVVMPEMNGKELSRKLRAISPHLKTIFMSGFPQEMNLLDEDSEHEMHFISKPFKIVEFTATIKAMLTESHSTQNPETETKS